jgi:hypothetical protein
MVTLWPFVMAMMSLYRGVSYAIESMPVVEMLKGNPESRFGWLC